MTATARLLLLAAAAAAAGPELTSAALPPGGAPFSSAVLPQPVPGAARAASAAGWRLGALCDLSRPPYSAANGSNATAALQRAIDDCGGLAGGGTVLIPRWLSLLTASLWLRSNLTLRVEGRLTSTATGAGLPGSPSIEDAPLVYTRRNSLMVTARAGMLNAGRCARARAVATGGDDCAEWEKLANVVLEGGGTGTLDGDGEAWYRVFSVRDPGAKNLRPMMLDLLWVDGLTVRDLAITRPGQVEPRECGQG